ncbi:hypothetical protein CK203_062266 [Vitis vinifera]|uniref:Uncharacterized protein n=1 Tax=Vitis vinifera TaxID=29760 RepID=A0A438FRE6_VITVI|nr:hypothetical protein CK203_062266 [Vitis vinifera]
MAGVSRRLDQIESSRQDHHPVGISTDDTVPHVPHTAQVFPLGTSHGVPFHLSDHCETAPPLAVTVPPPMVPTIEDTQLAKDDIPAASLPTKFRMPDIERYSGIGCPKIHLRLYSIVMRAHGIDDAQLVALFPMHPENEDPLPPTFTCSLFSCSEKVPISTTSMGSWWSFAMRPMRLALPETGLYSKNENQPALG